MQILNITQELNSFHNLFYLKGSIYFPKICKFTAQHQQDIFTDINDNKLS
nr:MAG TPA: hypothetical protein [Siphoviridae sp. ctUxW2]